VENKPNNTNNRKSFIFILIAIIAVIILAVILMNTLSATKIETISYSEFWEYVKAGRVEGVIMTDSYKARVLLGAGESGDEAIKDKPDAERTYAQKKGLYHGYSLDDFKKNAKKSDFYVMLDSRNYIGDALISYYNEHFTAADEVYKDGEGNFADKPYPLVLLNDPNSGVDWGTIVYLILFGAVIVGMFMFMRSNKGGSGALNFGKTKARLAANVKVRFSDVAGAEEEKEELKEIVEFLKAPKKFTAVGAKIPRGVLLVGPPGTGKTLFAKAVAGEANVPFFSISGSDFVEMFVGVGASRVRDLFAQAKKNMPCIVFIDEIDAVGRQRGAGLGGGNDEREQTLNQLLVQMDGFDTNDGVIIIAATNRADILDPALLRPGRFDRQVYVNSPDVKGREAIFKVHARNKPIAPDIDFKNLARLTSGFSGADIANLLNEAAILAARANRSVILMNDILEGINKVIAGPQKKSRIITESDKRITAYHEAGHAIVAKLMKHCEEVQEVSIIPRGMAAGYTISRPKNDNHHVSKNKLNDEIAMLLGGRACEELIIQDISTGASSDIKRATEIARSMVCEWGMSETLPNLFFGGDQEVFLGRDYKTQTSYSDSVAASIDAEIKKIIETNYQRALACLKKKPEVLETMVKLLFERETIYGDEVEMIMNGATVEEVLKFIDEKAEKQKEHAKKQPIIAPVFEPASTIIVKENEDGSASITIKKIEPQELSGEEKSKDNGEDDKK